jgi:hypothetical protein
MIKISVSIEDGAEPDFDAAIEWSEYGVEMGDEVTMHNFAVALSYGRYG